MQPNSQMPEPIMPPNAPTPYDFIINDSTGKKNKIIGSSGSQKQRVTFVIIGAIVLIIAGLVFLSVTSNSGKTEAQALIDVGAEQTEIIRVAALADFRSKSTVSQNLAINSSLTATTDLKKIGSILKQINAKIPVKALDAKRNPKIDTQLTTAQDNNNFDEVFIGIMNKQLLNYQSKLQAAFKQASSKEEKQLISEMNDHVNLLLSQLSSRSN